MPGTRHAWHAVSKVSPMGVSPFYRYKMRAVPCHVPDPRKNNNNKYMKNIYEETNQNK